MPRILLFSAVSGLLVVALGLPFAGCSETSTFRCGSFGGWCETGTEVCVQGADECSLCIPIERICTADDGCGCLDGVDLSSSEVYPSVDSLCADEPICAPQGEGLVLICERDDWGCG